MSNLTVQTPEDNFTPYTVSSAESHTKYKFPINRHVVNKTQDYDALTYKYETVEGTLQDFLGYLKQGFATCAGTFRNNHRKNENFDGTQFFIVDIDNNEFLTDEDGIPLKGEDGKRIVVYVGDERALTIEKALAMPFLREYCAISYTTPSHKAHHPKFRLIFRSPRWISDVEDHKAIVDYLLPKFPSDMACKALVSPFYGNTNLLPIFFNTAAVLPTSWIEEAIEARKEAKIEEDRKAVIDLELREKMANEFPEGTIENYIVEALNFIPRRTPGSGTYQESRNVVFALVKELGPHRAEQIASTWSPSFDGWNIRNLVKSCSAYAHIKPSITLLFKLAKQYGARQGYKVPLKYIQTVKEIEVKADEKAFDDAISEYLGTTPSVATIDEDFDDYFDLPGTASTTPSETATPSKNYYDEDFDVYFDVPTESLREATPSKTAKNYYDEDFDIPDEALGEGGLSSDDDDDETVSSVIVSRTPTVAEPTVAPIEKIIVSDTYLSPIDMGKKKLIFVDAPMGSGKTSVVATGMVAQFLQKYPEGRIFGFTPKILLGKKFALDLGLNYIDNLQYPAWSDTVVSCWNSIQKYARYDPSVKGHMLVLDEGEDGLIHALTSTTLTSKPDTHMSVLYALVQLLNAFGSQPDCHVVILQDGISETTKSFFRCYMKLENEAILDVKHTGTPPNKKTIHLFDSEKEVLCGFYEELLAGKKIFVTSDNRTLLEDLKKVCDDLGTKALLITRRTTSDAEVIAYNETPDKQNAAENYQVVLASPSFASGNSIDKEYFDSVVLIIKGIVDPRLAKQMPERARKTEKWYVYVPEVGVNDGMKTVQAQRKNYHDLLNGIFSATGDKIDADAGRKIHSAMIFEHEEILQHTMFEFKARSTILRQKYKKTLLAIWRSKGYEILEFGATEEEIEVIKPILSAAAKDRKSNEALEFVRCDVSGMSATTALSILDSRNVHNADVYKKAQKRLDVEHYPALATDEYFGDAEWVKTKWSESAKKRTVEMHGLFYRVTHPEYTKASVARRIAGILADTKMPFIGKVSPHIAEMELIQSLGILDTISDDWFCATDKKVVDVYNAAIAQKTALKRLLGISTDLTKKAKEKIEQEKAAAEAAGEDWDGNDVPSLRVYKAILKKMGFRFSRSTSFDSRDETNRDWKIANLEDPVRDAIHANYTVRYDELSTKDMTIRPLSKIQEQQTTPPQWSLDEMRKVFIAQDALENVKTPTDLHPIFKRFSEDVIEKAFEKLSEDKMANLTRIKQEIHAGVVAA